jgi:apolipoprotein N-acyltransferase
VTRSWRDVPAAVADGRMRTGPAVAVAAAGGLALAAAFPPAGLWPLAAAGPALLVVALWRRSLRGSLLIGLVFGLAFFTPLLSWTLNVAWYAWAALTGLNLVVFAPLVIGQRLLLRLRAWPLAVAGWWVASESLRDRWPFGGFPWGRLVMSQSAAPTARWVAIGGPSLLTFLVALAGACLAWLFLSAATSPRPARRAPVVPAACLLGAAGLALAGPLLPAGGVPAGTPSAEVAAVQGNVPRARDLPDLLREDTVTTNHALATEQLAARVKAGRLPAPDLVVWPENSTDQDPDANPYVYATIAQAMAAIGRPILVGAVLQDPQRNTGQLWLPGRGPAGLYVKRKLVPFGETIPLRGFLELFSSLPELQPVNFTPGHKAVVFRVGKIRLGDVICYEIGFDGLVSSEVAAGANLLTMQTNDADFEIDGQLGETQQQLAMARIRAVEHDRAVVVASTTGISAIIAPDGRLIAAAGTWQRAEIEARVPLVTARTLADDLGGWSEAILTGATLAALAWAIVTAIADRRRGAPDGPAARRDVTAVAGQGGPADRGAPDGSRSWVTNRTMERWSAG